jgi:hypothetical protein
MASGFRQQQVNNKSTASQQQVNNESTTSQQRVNKDMKDASRQNASIS